MELIRLTLTDKSETPVYINPLHVVAVSAQKKHTAIDTSGPGVNGHGRTFFVKETAEDVVTRLNGVPR